MKNSKFRLEAAFSVFAYVGNFCFEFQITIRHLFPSAITSKYRLPLLLSGFPLPILFQFIPKTEH